MSKLQTSITNNSNH